ncbi:MAG: hypothetical protein AABM31_11385, partial [Actinomycetota bacterium]
IDFHYGPGELVDERVSLTEGQRLEDGTEVLAVRLANAGDNPDVEVDANFQVRIAFSERD